jgi:general secretion pathway protein A
MFLDYFGLIEQPFGVTPDPRFLHLGPKHREALASLVYGTETNRGFLALIAQPGMGKTSLLFQYLEGLRNKARAAFLFQTDCDSRDFMRHLLTELGLDATGMDFPGMHAALNQVLTEEMRAGRRFILVIDEAQNLDERVLESVRLLSNFETPWMKLMQIVIAGQPQLAQRLARPSMAQLRQRISSVIRLDPFTPEETNAYVDHRLWVAGYAGPPLFTVGARLLIAEHSRGIPRNINNLCFNAMSIAYAMDAKQIDSKIIGEVVSDLEIESLVSDPISATIAHSSSRVFSPFGAPFSTMTAKKPAQPARRQHAWNMIPAIASAAAVLALGTASGLAWNRGMRTPPLDFLPASEAAVVPAGDVLAALPASAAAPAASGHLSAINATLPVAAADATTSRGPTITVVVEKEATLRHLSLQYLGRFDEAAILEIFSLNPQITDPGHIEAGQRLRLPLYLRRQTPSERESASKIAPGNSQGETP